QEIANARDGLRSSPRRSQMSATVCDLLPRDRKCTRSFAISSQEIANARDGLRSPPKRSQMHAMVCDLLPRDRKCTRSFAIFSQEIANARDGLRSSPRRSQMSATVCDLLPRDRKCTRWFANFSQEIAIHPVHFKKVLRSQFFADVPGYPESGGQVIVERQLGSSASRAPAPFFECAFIHPQSACKERSRTP